MTKEERNNGEIENIPHEVAAHTTRYRDIPKKEGIEHVKRKLS